MAENTPTSQMTAQQKADAAKAAREGQQEGYVASLRESTVGASEAKLAEMQNKLQEYSAEASRLYALQQKYHGTDKHWTHADRYNREKQGFEARAREMRAKINELQKGEHKLNKDLMRGAEFGSAVLGKDGLGRLAEDVDIQEALGRYKDIADKGLSRAEVEAEKSQAFKEIQGSTETARRQLQAQLARMGVRGATAGRQVGNILAQGMQKQADVSRDLFLKSEQVKRQGLQDYSSRLGDMKTFDLGQAAAEKNIVLQAGLGIAQVGSAERAAKYAAEQQRLASQARASAGGCFVKGTMIELKDGSSKPINEIEIGTELKTGVVNGVMVFAKQKDMYNFNGVIVSNSHYVYDIDGVWKRVEDTGAEKVEIEDEYVYVLNTTTGTIEINGMLFADYEGFADCDNVDEIILGEMNEFTKDVLSREVCS